MKNLTYSITGILLLFALAASGQGLNNFTNLVVQSGAVLHVKNDMTNQTGGTVSNAGEVRISGNFGNSGTPTINSLVVLDGAGAQSVTGNSTFNGVLQVSKTGGTATVSSGTTGVSGILRLDEGVMNANGNLVMTSSASATGIVDDFSNAAYDGTLNGNLRVQRYVTGASGFHYIGPAVNNPNVAELSEIGLYGPNGAQIIPQPDCDPNNIDASSPYGAMFEWRENGPWTVAGCQQSGWVIRSSGTMQNGRGYGAIVSTGTTLEIGGAVGNTSEIATVAYSGLANTNATGDGWHLVSNPFPSPIQWFAPPAGFNGQAQIWQTSGAYSGTYQPVLPHASNPAALIASTQGFFVRSSGGPANFSLPQTYRRLGNPTFYKEDIENTFDIIVKSGGFADMTRVRFGYDGETNEFDPMLDANKLKAMGAQPTIMTRMGMEEYSINSMPIEDHPMTIPMDLYPGISGEFQISAQHLDRFNVEAHVYLEDLKLGKIQELTVNPVYNFSADESDDPERFFLHFRLNREEPISTGTDISIYSSDHSAFVFIPELKGVGQIEVFDAIGNLVFVTSTLNEGKNSFDLNHLATGAYVLRALINGDAISKKIIL
jgi:hypothetical protein